MEPAEQGRAGEGLQGRRVLLVEDNAINQQIAREILAGAGILVEVVDTGEEAVERLRGPAPRYDAVLMDIHMPGMGGYAAARLIRSRPENRDLPIIAMTADAMARDLERCLAAGMNDHLAKPIDVEKLFATLARWTRGDGGGCGDVMDGAAGELPGLPDLPGIDGAQGLYRLNGNAHLYRQLLKGFASGHGDDATAITRALAAGDLPLVRQLAHNLKGVAGNLGALRLAAAAGALETALGSPPTGGYAPFAEELGRSLQEAVDGIRRLDRESAPAPPPSSPVLDPAALAETFDDLVRQLGASATEAISIWELRLAPALGGRIRVEQLETVDAAIQSLDFERALAELQGVGKSLGLPPYQ